MNNNIINCIAIDNDIISLSILSNLINEIPFLQLKEKFIDTSKALSYAQQNKTDLIISEIELDNPEAIRLTNYLNYKPLIIFVSSNMNNAYKAFNANAIDLLVKPLSLERLLQAVNKAQYYSTELPNHLEFDNQSFVLSNIFVKANYKIIKLQIKDILYIEGYNDYVKIHTGNNKPILSLISLSKMEKRLPVNQFIRVHRSYIVSIDKIESIERKRINIGKHNIPISQTHYNTFLSTLEKMNVCFY
jgi:two-component system, LytTR family, response regulator